MSRYLYGHILPGDYAWGGEVTTARPVIRVNPDGVLLGIQRGHGGWLTTAKVAWNDVRGHLPAAEETHELADELRDAATRVRRGFLDYDQREHLAVLLDVLGAVPTLPTPVVAALSVAVDALNHAVTDTGPVR